MTNLPERRETEQGHGLRRNYENEKSNKMEREGVRFRGVRELLRPKGKGTVLWGDRRGGVKTRGVPKQGKKRERKEERRSTIGGKKKEKENKSKGLGHP